MHKNKVLPSVSVCVCLSWLAKLESVFLLENFGNRRAEPFQRPKWDSLKTTKQTYPVKNVAQTMGKKLNLINRKKNPKKLYIKTRKKLIDVMHGISPCIKLSDEPRFLSRPT